MNSFVEMVLKKFPKCLSMEGYSDKEILQIEAIYDVEVGGELYEFMAGVGRSAGVLGSRIILHDCRKNLRKHLLCQEGLKECLYNAGEYETVSCNPLFLFGDSDTAYYFVKTKGVDEFIYQFIEGTEEMSCCNMTIKEFFLQEVAYIQSEDPIPHVGDLLRLI